MKTTLTILALSLIMYGYLSAQNISARTNEFKVNYKPGAEPINTYLPTISWLSPAEELSQSKELKLNIMAQIKSDFEISSVVISLMDTPDDKPNATKEIVIKPGEKFVMIVDQTLFLKAGNNYIQLEVTNVDGATSIDHRIITAGEDAIASAFAGNRKDYALLFAADKYDEWSDLVNPIDDASTIQAELTKYYGFETELVTNASQDQVIEKIREYTTQKQFNPQDQLFILFAGHGHYDDTFNEGYVVARNSLKNDPSFNSYISYNRLRSLINNIDCDHILVMLDVCFGGTFDESLRRGEDIYSDQARMDFIVTKLGYKTRKFVTSGGKTYVSDGIPGKHSPFTRRILEALRNFGGSDRVLTYNELLSYIEKVRPTPHYGNFGDNEPGSDFMFIIK